MCTTRRPKPQASSSEEKKPQYLTNTYLDSPWYRAAAIGRNALRIDPGTPVPTQTPPPTNPPVIPPVDPRGPGGGYQGGGVYRPGLGIATGGTNVRYQML